MLTEAYMESIYEKYKGGGGDGGVYTRRRRRFAYVLYNIPYLYTCV